MSDQSQVPAVYLKVTRILRPNAEVAGLDHFSWKFLFVTMGYVKRK